MRCSGGQDPERFLSGRTGEILSKAVSDGSSTVNHIPQRKEPFLHGIRRWQWPLLIGLLWGFALPSGVRAEGIFHLGTLPPGPRPVPVVASFFLSDISDIDDQNETFRIKGLLKLEWRDERHAFDAKA